MKKIFTLLSLAALAANVYAQAPEKGSVQTMKNNYVFYMCAPGDNKAVDTPVGYKNASQVSAMEELGFNYSNYDSDNTNQVVLTRDYTDAETGAAFPKGYYYPDKVGDSRSYFGSEGVSGLKNVKKMIFYFAATSTGGVQFSSYHVKEGGCGSVPSDQNPTTGYTPGGANGVRCSMDLNNKIKFFVPQNEAVAADGTRIFTSADKDGVGSNYYCTALADGKPTPAWTEFACDQPLKLVLDYTQTSEKFDSNYDFLTDKTGTITVPYGTAKVAKQDANGKEVAGDAIPWSADNILQQGYKKSAYLLGIAIICGDEGAKTYYANVSESTDDDEATWHESAEAAHTPFADTDEPANNLFFSWKMTPEMKQYIHDNYKPSADGISSVAVGQTPDAPAYNLAGQAVGKDFKGVVIRSGKKSIQR